MARSIIFNADDLGIHPTTDQAILLAFKEGIISSATLLMTTPFTEQAADLAISANLPIGIHLSLTLGKPVAAQNENSELQDNLGWMSRTPAFFFKKLLFLEHRKRLVPQIAAEFSAQLAKAADLGIKPTHVDSHQHVHMARGIMPILEELLPYYGLRKIRLTREPLWSARLAGKAGIWDRRNGIKGAAIYFSNSKPRSLVTPDHFFGLYHSGVLNEERLLGILQKLPANSTSEVGFHPGKSIVDNVYPQPNVNAFIASSERETEFATATSSRVKQFLKDQRINTISFREL
ncbi:ChbG/HpnK family deacetylase [Desulfovibrio subterraneus]|uniref:carbohydrate deacetylase n=1 Tax=Desulfovibrio subterraneus TaxID=2718620 RepID=UPI0022B86DCB|nr:ChbG/HpnK family deacetylase [Desulfovibrio subterraneus]WBF66272.1 ChbG/HpnK family deacetylase [Desulfovibrio subterraneus]